MTPLFTSVLIDFAFSNRLFPIAAAEAPPCLKAIAFVKALAPECAALTPTLAYPNAVLANDVAGASAAPKKGTLSISLTILVPSFTPFPTKSAALFTPRATVVTPFSSVPPFLKNDVAAEVPF